MGLLWGGGMCGGDVGGGDVGGRMWGGEDVGRGCGGHVALGGHGDVGWGHGVGGGWGGVTHGCAQPIPVIEGGGGEDGICVTPMDPPTPPHDPNVTPKRPLTPRGPLTPMPPPPLVTSRTMKVPPPRRPLQGFGVMLGVCVAVGFVLQLLGGLQWRR